MLILIICHSLERNYKMLQKMYPLFKDLDNSKVLIETRNVFAKILYHATIIPVHSSPANVENI